MRQPRRRGNQRRRWLYLVQPTVILIPPWALDCQPKDFARDPTKAWLPRAVAGQIARMDREDGGTPTVIKSEYRRCKICGVLYLGVLGMRQRWLDRKLDDRAMQHDPRTCGPDCRERARRNRLTQRLAR
jgi:hypothetical protein